MGRGAHIRSDGGGRRYREEEEAATTVQETSQERRFDIKFSIFHYFIVFSKKLISIHAQINMRQSKCKATTAEDV